MDKKEFEFKFGSKPILTLFLFAVSVFAVFIITLALHGGLAAFCASIIASPLLWILIHACFSRWGKAIMYSDRVQITLGDEKHEILYKDIRTVTREDRSFFCWLIFIDKEVQEELDAAGFFSLFSPLERHEFGRVFLSSPGIIRPWSKSLSRFMRELRKEVDKPKRG